MAIESIFRARFLSINYSVFNDLYSASILYFLTPENLCNKSFCGCQILAFNGAACQGALQELNSRVGVTLQFNSRLPGLILRLLGSNFQRQEPERIFSVALARSIFRTKATN